MSGENVSFPSDNSKGDARGYFVGDSSSTQGLIVVHEWWGLNNQTKEQGTELAKAGNFQVVVLDLYRGEVAEDKETAGHLMGHLDWKGAVQDVSACAKFLKSRGCQKVGITGFCMGGALSLASAALSSEIDAAAPFYGLPGAELCDISTIKIPVQCHFGKKDEIAGFSSKADYDAAFKKMKDGGVNVELFEYDAGHAFLNPENRIGDNYDEKIATEATGRLVEFMKNNLK